MLYTLPRTAPARTRSNPTEIVPRVPIPPRGPPRGLNRHPGGPNRKSGKNSLDLTHFLTFKPPGRYPLSRCPRSAGPVGRNRTVIGGPDHELRLKPAKPAKTAHFTLRHPRLCAIAPAPDRTRPNPLEPDRNRPPRADPAPRSAPGLESPPGGPKPQKRQKRPRSYPFFNFQITGPLPTHPDAPARLVLSDETEP